ncbi:ATP-binding protein [Streptomyces chumphonensis]|uniref:ATP-binding protein n=1 Tax=Streptomyces chumphonensis TaxID=1214925 RepID=A0A927IDZ0_9ACTN|nr:ATP-binding protein [Streptomyces chumphonensis]MBD3933164.1 ATP-binding protein [Streptomyces chumphonensis]
MAFVVAQEVPTSSTMAVPHGPVGVGPARRRMRDELRASGTPDAVVDDAVLILSELLSNAARHARPLPPDESVRAGWHRGVAGEVTISVTDGGGPTRPLPATPSVTARGGRGLSIITTLAQAWGVREDVEREAVTVWAVVGRPEFGAGAKNGHAPTGLDGIEGLDGFEGLDGIGV